MEQDNKQFMVQDGILEIPLSGDKLSKGTNSLDLINKFGIDLYTKNKDFIKEKVKENWFAVIEPVSGILIASDSQLKVFNYTTQKYAGKVLFVIGLIKDTELNYAGRQ